MTKVATGLVAAVIAASQLWVTPCRAADPLGDLGDKIESLQARVQTLETTLDMCNGAVGRVQDKLDVATNKDEKARLRKYVGTYQSCVSTTKGLAGEGRGIGQECGSVWDELMKYDEAPAGSDGAKKATLFRKKATTCVGRIETWLRKVEKADTATMDEKVLESFRL